MTTTANSLGIQKITVTPAGQPELAPTCLDDQLAEQVVAAYNTTVAHEDDQGATPGQAHTAGLRAAGEEGFAAGRSITAQLFTDAYVNGRRGLYPTTTAAHRLRLHLLSAHGEINALELPDPMVRMLHEHLHAVDAGHRATSREWDEPRCQQVIEDVPEQDGRAAVANAYNDIVRAVDNGE